MAGAASDHRDASGDAAEASDASSQQPASKKRRQAPVSSRGVANLTPEQLARKRANDREAQRAIRERTKNQIDLLNNRIRELENQQPYQNLQLVIREKEAVLAENADIRTRLESVLSIIQPILRAAGGLNELAAAAERSPLPIPPHHHGHGLVHPHPTSHPADPRTFNATLGEMAASPLNGFHSPAGTESGRQWPVPGDAPTSHVRRWPGDDQQHEQSSEMTFDERMGVDFLIETNGQRRSVDPNLPPPAQPTTVRPQGIGQHAPELIPHLTLPRHVPTTCPLDAILLDFLQERQVRLSAGDPMKTVVGPLYPNFTSVVYPERNVEAHPLSKLFADILRTFPDIFGLPEQVAIVYIMFLIMRWQIDPSQENYDRLPDWVTPRASQLFVPHPVWCDYLPWPRLRDRMIATQPFNSFDTFFIPYTTTISINWPYEPRDCLLPASKLQPSSHSATSSVPASSPYSTAVNAGSPPGSATPQPIAGSPGFLRGHLPKEDDQWLINPAFESHLRNLSNWSLGPSFRSSFPQFSETVRIKEGR